MMRTAIQRETVGHNAILQLRPKSQHCDALRIAVPAQSFTKNHRGKLARTHGCKCRMKAVMTRWYTFGSSPK